MTKQHDQPCGRRRVGNSWNKREAPYRSFPIVIIHQRVAVHSRYRVGTIHVCSKNNTACSQSALLPSTTSIQSARSKTAVSSSGRWMEAHMDLLKRNLCKAGLNHLRQGNGVCACVWVGAAWWTRCCRLPHSTQGCFLAANKISVM